jgi:hypothetical protein
VAHRVAVVVPVGRGHAQNQRLQSAIRFNLKR